MSGIRAFLVVAFSAFVLITTVPNILVVAHGIGDFGFDVDWSNTIVNVRAGGPGARAGLRDGDRIDARANAPQEREMLDLPDYGVRFPKIGQRVTIQIVRSGRSVPVQVVAGPRAQAAYMLLAVTKRLTGLIFIVT